MGKIFIDGKQLHGIRKLNYSVEVKEAPVLMLEMYCEGMEITSNGYVNVKRIECVNCKENDDE